MGPVLGLLALIWGISPFFLIWVLINTRDKAKQLPEALSRLNATTREREQLSQKLAADNVEIEVLCKNRKELGSRLLKDNVKFVSSKVTANNYATSKKLFRQHFRRHYKKLMMSMIMRSKD